MEAETQLMTLDELGLGDNPRPTEPPTIKENQDRRSGFMKLMLFAQYFTELYPVRRDRRRNLDYLNGDQWEDIVEVNGQRMTESEYIKRQGRVPLKNNKIQEIVRNIIGQYRSNPPQPVIISRDRDKQGASEMLNNALEACLSNNQSGKMDAAALREFLVSGICCNRISYDEIPEKDMWDAIFDNETVDHLFYNSDVSDPRLKDLNVIGRYTDMPLDNVIGAFAKNNADEYLIREEYAAYSNKDQIVGKMNNNTSRYDDFFLVPDNNNVRLYEVWEKVGEWRYMIHDPMKGKFYAKPKTDVELSNIMQENERRQQVYSQQGIPQDKIPFLRVNEKYHSTWYYRFMTPSGMIIREDETPFEHGSHPFVLTLHPLIDHKVKGYVSDLIDPQRYINRLMITIDFIIASSSKGVLMVPEESISDDFPMEDIAEEWTKFNGVIKIKAKAGVQLPKQISSNNTNIGIFDLLNVQMQQLQQGSGVSGAAQGQTPKSGTPFARYAMEANNSSINLIDIFMTFNDQLRDRDRKLLKTIVQFYDAERYINIGGKNYSEDAMTYRPDVAHGLDWDNKVTEGVSTPVIRQLSNELLMELRKLGDIDGKMLLKNGHFPGGDKILEDLERREQEMQQMSPEQMQEMAMQNPEGQQMVNRLMAG